MSSSLRYFTVTSGATTANPLIVDSANVRLGDTLPLAFAFTFVAAGDPIPNGGGAVAGPNGDFVINTDFLPPAAAGDLVSAFARGATPLAGATTEIAEADSAIIAPIETTGDSLAKGLTVNADGSFTVDNAGVYDINAVLSVESVGSALNMTVSVQTSPDAGATYATVPQGEFTIVGCPTVETLKWNVYTGALVATDRIRIIATATTTSGAARPVASPAADYQFVVSAGSFLEAQYLGTI